MKKSSLLLLIAYFTLFYCRAQVITTIAGNGIVGYWGDGGSATTSELSFPVGLAVDKTGNIYIADYHNHRIRKVTTLGIISTFAGTGTAGYSGDGSPATSAELNFPCAIAFDPNGNLFIVDENNNRIRKVDTSGIISTVAGNGSTGYTGDGGPAVAATFNYPLAIAVDQNSNIYVVDINNNCIRKIDTTGTINTFSGNGTAGYMGDGGPANSAEFNGPQAVAADPNGNIYIADAGNNRIRKVNAFGIVSTFAGTGIPGFSGDGGPATSAKFSPPTGVSVDSVGDVYISDFDNNRIRKVNSFGVISSIAGNGIAGFSGDGGLASAAELYYPQGVAIDHSGNIFIADENNQRVRKISGSTSLIEMQSNRNSTINIFPNPANTELTITYTDKVASVVICNIVGQTLYDIPFDKFSMTPCNVKINVADMPSGVYFVKVNGMEVRKFVKE